MIDWLNDNSGAVQGMAVAGLVVVTAIYAALTLLISRAAGRQADANVEMAREMREQRYEALRPMVDIRHDAEGLDRRKTEIWAEEGVCPFGVCVSLRNEGRGPALKLVYSAWDEEEKASVPTEVGVLGARSAMDPHWLAAVRSPETDAAGVVIVRYDDVLGRCFESRLPVGRDGSTGRVELRGPLKSPEDQA